MGMSIVERLMGGDSEPREERCKLVKLANAAPELLAACELAEIHFRDKCDNGAACVEIQRLRAAIAQARGK